MVSSFCLQQCMHSVGHWFHQLMYNFHPMLFHSSCSFFQRSSLLVGRSLWSRSHRSTLFQRCSIGFMSGDCESHGNIVIPWSSNRLIIDLLVCFGLLSYWNTRSSIIFYQTSLTYSWCPIICFDNARYSFFLRFWSTPHVSVASLSNPYVLLPIHALIVCDYPKGEVPSSYLQIVVLGDLVFFFQIFYCVSERCDIWNLLKKPLTFYCITLLFYLHQSCQVTIIPFNTNVWLPWRSLILQLPHNFITFNDATDCWWWCS